MWEARWLWCALAMKSRSMWWSAKFTGTCPAEEFDLRLRQWKPPVEKWQRGYQTMFAKHVTQAHEGCDFDFLAGNSPDCDPDIF
jgi:hypothetical protein